MVFAVKEELDIKVEMEVDDEELFPQKNVHFFNIKSEVDENIENTNEITLDIKTKAPIKAEVDSNPNKTAIKHECELCDLTTSRKFYPGEHVQSSHEGIKHNCELCFYNKRQHNTYKLSILESNLVVYNVISRQL